MKKTYVLDTNVLIDAPDAIEKLQDNGENQVAITWTVLQELDKLKGLTKTRHRALEAISKLHENPEVIICDSEVNLTDLDLPDDRILWEVKTCAKLENPIIVSNDTMMRYKAEKIHNIESQQYKQLVPFKAESQKITGFVFDTLENIPINHFFWIEGKLHCNKNGEYKKIDYENSPWGIIPKSPYQNAALELILDENIDLVTIQSEAGFGKTYISLAAALFLVLEEKRYKKIYVIKPNIEIGQELGFLPGDLDDKLEPYFRNVHNLLLKLHESRACNRVFKKDVNEDNIYSISSVNKAKFEYVPLNFLRGMEFSDAVVIIDETQNLTKDQLRLVLSRMGENIKCICTGDTEQVDNPACNSENNGLNWAVKLFNGQKNYGHVLLRGNSDRGNICALVRKCWK